MKVRKNGQATNPGYPSRRQFVGYGLLVGMAAIGLSAAVGRGQEGRLRGDVAVEPRAPGAPRANVRPVGEIRADPGTSCAATNAPSASTNQVSPAVSAQSKGKPKEPAK